MSQQLSWIEHVVQLHPNTRQAYRWRHSIELPAEIGTTEESIQR
ncbi:MAG TPA: hypothetical protein VFK44_07800 [Bacillales bacterium]|nr:hypothetical protein [Bacillales bacterium]